jgi:hypothetical protein
MSIQPRLGWSLLRRTKIKKSEARAVEELLSDSGVAVGLLTLSDNLATAMFPMSQSMELNSIEIPKYLKARQENWRWKGKEERYLTVQSSLPRLEPVFADFVTNVAFRVLDKQSTERAFLEAIDDFRDLFAMAASDVTDNEICGLVGELLLLNELLSKNSFAWQSWVGPMDRPHDFTHALNSIEVKTTANSDGNLVEISSKDQLVPPAGGTLHIARIALDQVSDGPLYVSALVAQARTLASSIDGLDKVLLKAGYFEGTNEHWDRLRFRPVSTTFYVVNQDFPAIWPSSFVSGEWPSGIREATYSIDLAHAKSNRLTTEAASTLLTEFNISR